MTENLASHTCTLSLSLHLSYTGTVDEQACSGGPGGRDCYKSVGNIGFQSCKGTSGCENNSADIGQQSCQGFKACMNNKADIDDESCTLGPDSCTYNEGLIGKVSCRGTRSCFRNKGLIGSNSVSGRCKRTSHQTTFVPSTLPF